MHELLHLRRRERTLLPSKPLVPRAACLNPILSRPSNLHDSHKNTFDHHITSHIITVNRSLTRPRWWSAPNRQGTFSRQRSITALASLHLHNLFPPSSLSPASQEISQMTKPPCTAHVPALLPAPSTTHARRTLALPPRRDRHQQQARKAAGSHPCNACARIAARGSGGAGHHVDHPCTSHGDDCPEAQAVAEDRRLISRLGDVRRFARLALKSILARPLCCPRQAVRILVGRHA